MYTTFCVSRETAYRFVELLPWTGGLRNAGCPSLPNGSVPYYLARDWQTKKPKPLDADVARIHLNGDITQPLRHQPGDAAARSGSPIDADFDGPSRLSSS